METDTGRVLTRVVVENLGDIVEVERGSRSPGEVRRVAAEDALVDTGATTIALPTRLIRELGLRKVYEKQAKSTRGVGPVSVYEAVRLTIEGRFCSVDVMEVPDDVPVLIEHLQRDLPDQDRNVVGQIPLEMLDLVVDVQGRRLIGNPAHGGEHVLELF